ncbi:hypothetical protein UlMin_033180 [Ulmus minor]
MNNFGLNSIRGYSIRYHYAGTSLNTVFLMGSLFFYSDHWRKNIPILAKSQRVSIDLIGYGYSDIPNPRQFGDTSFYTFETWATQLNEFCKDPHCFLINTALGQYFFKIVATPKTMRIQNILILGLEPGAMDVFLEFMCYSGGPLLEELLPQVKCLVLIARGDKDPWEPVELRRAYANFHYVEDFVVLPNVDHCPQDEAPSLVNPLVESFVAHHVTSLVGNALITIP